MQDAEFFQNPSGRGLGFRVFCTVLALRPVPLFELLLIHDIAKIK
jgi:hypothetical protein